MHENKDYFLATTALEEFWDSKKPIIFLSPGCLCYEHKELWGRLDYSVIDYPFNTSATMADAQAYITKIYYQLLPELTVAMNKIHSVNLPEASWEMMLGHWLWLYLAVLYDRYVSIKMAQQSYPNFTTILLEEDCFITPVNMTDFCGLVGGDKYNLQLYSKILVNLEKKFPTKSFKIRDKTIDTKSFIKPLIKNCYNKFIKSIAPKKSITLVSAYFNFFAYVQLFIKSKGKVWAYFPIEVVKEYNLNESQRLPLKDILLADTDEFVNVLQNMLWQDVPMVYVEGFKDLSKIAESYLPNKTKAITSAVAWHLDEVFQYWAAKAKLNGTKLIGIQHGGNYGMFDHLHPEERELRLTDYYFSWGKAWSLRQKKITPMFISKLCGMKDFAKQEGNSKEILWLFTIDERYRRYLIPFTGKYLDYLAWQKRFYLSLTKAVAENIIVRPPQNDLRWFVPDRLREFAPTIKITYEAASNPFLTQLKQCRLFVCNNLGTTYLEALALNKPTVLYWDPSLYGFLDDVAADFEELKDAGILFYSPEAAAEAVNAIYNDVDSWWQDPKRQQARKSFCDKYARTSNNAINEWVKEFNKILND